MRTGRELLIASKEFAKEHRWLSWWHLWSTMGLLVGLLVFAALPVHMVLRVAASLFAGLVCVRTFIIFHDFQHHAILNKSRVAGAVLWIYGIWTLNPPSVWNRSHSHHHKHNSKNFGANVGSFPIMTKESFKVAPAWERFVYLASRHPLTIFFGYLTIFAWGMSLRPFLQNPIRHFDGGFALVFQVCLLVTLYNVFGPTTMLLSSLLPLFFACLIGGYLFYSQHNYPEAKLRTGDDWNHVEAALESSSFTKMGPILNWFTGNIGFHHVHHMNALIPFYRLPEAMDAMVELQSPGVTTLRPRDIRACLKLKVWDTASDRFVSLSE